MKSRPFNTNLAYMAQIRQNIQPTYLHFLKKIIDEVISTEVPGIRLPSNDKYQVLPIFNISGFYSAVIFKKFV